MFYTIEGIDGAGCGVVRRALEKKLEAAGLEFETLKYPVPSLPFGRDIYDFLDSKIEMSSEVQFLAFLGQMVAEKDRIKKLRQKIVIVDRYMPCTLVFQGAKGFSLEKGLELTKLFALENPDRIFYLQLPWEIGYDRKVKEGREGDRHEKDITMFQKTEAVYEKLLKLGVMADWTVIDATKTPEEEAQEIFKVIEKDIVNNSKLQNPNVK